MFVTSLARLAENQLLQYDNMLIVDDVEKGRKCCTVVIICSVSDFALNADGDKNP